MSTREINLSRQATLLEVTAALKEGIAPKRQEWVSVKADRIKIPCLGESGYPANLPNQPPSAKSSGG